MLPRGSHVGPLSPASSRYPSSGRAMETGCWLLGGDFEDSVFEERRERRPGLPASYRAKRCEPQVRGRAPWPLSGPRAAPSSGPGRTAPASSKPRCLGRCAHSRLLGIPTPGGTGVSGAQRRALEGARNSRAAWGSTHGCLASSPSFKICSNSRVPSLALQLDPQQNGHLPLYKP